jgi:5-methylcytosine-specific restriction endonuclease McrA
MRVYGKHLPEEARTRKNQRQKEYYSIEENRIRKLEAQRAYRATEIGRAKHKEEQRLYNLNNRPSITLRTIAYRARKAQAKGTATLEQVKARIEYYGGLCWICKAPYREIDHVIPLTKGGTNWPANLRPICRSCNASKGNKWPYKPVTQSIGG